MLERATVVESLSEAIADCVYVVGTSARARAIDWPSMEPRACAAKLRAEAQRGPVAVVFGPEKSGLSNADLDLCDTLLTIPTDPDFSSLNLAMAVQVVSYELRAAQEPAIDPEERSGTPLATSGDVERFYEHLERVLTDIGFLDPDNPRHLMRRLRRLFIRARPDQNEINILRGILTAVERGYSADD